MSAFTQAGYRGCGPGDTQPASGRFANQAADTNRDGGGEALRGDRVIAAMAVAGAGISFFLHVGHLTAGGDFAIAADPAPAPQSSEAESPKETHPPLHC